MYPLFTTHLLLLIFVKGVAFAEIMTLWAQTNIEGNWNAARLLETNNKLTDYSAQAKQRKENLHLVLAPYHLKKSIKFNWIKFPLQIQITPHTTMNHTRICNWSTCFSLFYLLFSNLIWYNKHETCPMQWCSSVQHTSEIAEYTVVLWAIVSFPVHLKNTWGREECDKMLCVHIK